MPSWQCIEILHHFSCKSCSGWWSIAVEHGDEVHANGIVRGVDITIIMRWRMENLLWVEEYRPKNIDECILPKSIKKTFKEFVEE